MMFLAARIIFCRFLSLIWCSPNTNHSDRWSGNFFDIVLGENREARFEDAVGLSCLGR